ncbi:MAG: hypothetical protein DRH79_03930 [Candidatus Cloacimonadota bacterium]|nr:MAG: hypothetical protein DRH79_03930 [Candidatus Cloacimonadota bacterium]
MKKVLVIVYYWPPSGGAGVQRWLKFVKYLPQFDWQPTVITTSNGDYPAIDESLLKEVPEDIKVIRTKTPTFGKWFSKAGEQSAPYGSLETSEEDSFFRRFAIWCRLNLTVPDARVVWNKYALQAAFEEMRKFKYDLIITSGPPHSTHLIGRKLKNIFNVKWLVDFRDPWTKIDYLEKVNRFALTKKIDEKLEQKIINQCDRIISINKSILKGLKAINKGIIIPNGFDPADFTEIEKKKTKKFQINYFGNITAERDPSIVLKAVNQIYSQFPDIQINIWGNVSDEVKADLISLDENKFVKFHNYIPHDKMMRRMVNSSLLLLLINNVPNNLGILTGKIYEYLGAKVPVLGVGPIEGEAAKILNETRSGKMCDYSDQKAISEFISWQYSMWKKDEKPTASGEIDQYDRVHLTKNLAEVLESL